ncbi:uncharacterized protein METZ01_LOCUS84460 [marine metagenome]|jgi:hypothetical protein|uniref:Peptidase S1 domain-containing protein n=1 Tax=marine metagenome TaxID=408172 RepID=A0A381UTY6_9ZZZZ
MRTFLAVLIFLVAAPVSGSKILRVGRGDRVGTGFVIASKTTGDKHYALMITAKHVVDTTAGNAWAKNLDKTLVAIPHSVGGSNVHVWMDGSGNDIAAFAVETSELWKPYTIGIAEAGKVYLAYGYGSGTFKATKLKTKYRLEGTVRQGDSGGPIFNDGCQIVGMAVEITGTGNPPVWTHTNAVEPEVIGDFAKRVLAKIKWLCPPGGT